VSSNDDVLAETCRELELDVSCTHWTDEQKQRDFVDRTFNSYMKLLIEHLNSTLKHPLSKKRVEELTTIFKHELAELLHTTVDKLTPHDMSNTSIALVMRPIMNKAVDYRQVVNKTIAEHGSIAPLRKRFYDNFAMLQTTVVKL
jgi:hypothetical protein